MAKRPVLAVLMLHFFWAFCGGPLGAAVVDGRLTFKGEPVSRQAAFLAALLAPGRDPGATAGSVRFALPEGMSQARDSAGHWMAPALQAALASQGALAFHGDPAQAGAPEPGPRWRLSGGSSGGGSISASGLPRVLLLENSATISPLSRGLSAWGWPVTGKSFADAESDPSKLLDADAVDLVAVESPAGWGAGDEPSGPSEMSDAVAAALRDFVRRGGTAVFFDISQWDVEKVWPASVGLAPVGPYAVSKLSFFKGPRGGISLSNFGEVADSLKRPEAFSLVGSRAFDFADGSRGPVYAAWAMPDPSGGLGFVAGLAFHVFDQDDSDSLSSAAQRLLLNLFLLSGAKRISIQGETPPPEPPVAAVPATAMPTQAAPTPVPTEVPPTPTPLPPTPTSVQPTALPSTPTPVPPSPTPPPPTALPSFAPPSPEPNLPPPTAVPTQAPPTEAPTPLPPAPVATFAVPQPIPPAQPLFTAPTAVPSPWVPAPMPVFLPPTPMPTPVPTAAMPISVPMAPLPPLPPSAPVLPPATETPYVYPTPTPQPAPRSRRRRRRRLVRGRPTPTPEARPTVAMRPSIQNALGCLASAPEPFADGGVYIEFCLSHAAKVRIEVFDATGMKLWTSDMKLLQPGQQQWWFEGAVQGRALEAGSYLFEITADYGDGMSESRQGSMTRGQDRP